jgi:hypothetical protein
VGMKRWSIRSILCECAVVNLCRDGVLDVVFPRSHWYSTINSLENFVVGSSLSSREESNYEKGSFIKRSPAPLSQYCLSVRSRSNAGFPYANVITRCSNYRHWSY